MTTARPHTCFGPIQECDFLFVVLKVVFRSKMKLSLILQSVELVTIPKS
jgi:hypothetical protein